MKDISCPFTIDTGRERGVGESGYCVVGGGGGGLEET